MSKPPKDHVFLCLARARNGKQDHTFVACWSEAQECFVGLNSYYKSPVALKTIHSFWSVEECHDPKDSFKGTGEPPVLETPLHQLSLQLS